MAFWRAKTHKASEITEGKFPLERLVDAVCSETEADGKITTHKNDANAHHTPSTPGVGLEATVALFQANSATGTFAVAPGNINDNNTGATAAPDAVDQYCEIDYKKVVTIKRWRHFGAIQTAGTIWKIQYYNLSTHSWVDWVIDIPIRITADWGGFSTETEVLTDKIRWVCTTIDIFNCSIGEIEVIY